MTMRPRLLVTRRLPHAVEACLSARYDVTLNPSDQPLDRHALIAAISDYDALLPTITDRLDAEVLGVAHPRVRIVANFGAGLDHVDLAAAQRAGIVVTNTPDALTEATADVALMLILMTLRQAGAGERELRAGQWTGWRPTHMLGRTLSGKTLGLVGFGRIARAVAVRAQAFGMAVRFVSRRPVDPAVAAAIGALAAPDLATLVADADVLSLHVPGGPATRHLVDAALLARMKRGAVLINTARGAVVDEAALVAALETGQIAAAGLDVYEHEPAVHPGLVARDDVVLLPHLGSATVETREAMGMQAVANLDAFFAGQLLPNHVA